jgi:hypothetical protein
VAGRADHAQSICRGYFLPSKIEGMYVPLSHNCFEYPHPLIKIDEFFW